MEVIKYWHGKKELFHLSEDPAESNDLAEAFPNRVTEMDRFLVEKLESDGSQAARPNPNYRP